MALISYTNKRGLDSQLPVFDLSSRLVYFYDLLEDKGNVPVSGYFAKQKKALYAKAQTQIVAEGNQLLRNPNKDSHIYNAIDFLKRAAISERAKEIQIIKNFEEKLKKIWNSLPNKDSDLAMSIDEILQTPIDVDNPFPPNMNQFYLNLTKAINLVRTESMQYTARLQQIIDRNAKEYKELAETQVDYRIQGDMQALITEVLGSGQRYVTQTTKKKGAIKTDNISKLIREAVIQYASSPQIHLWNRSNLEGEDIFGFLMAIIVDMENFIQKEYYSKMKPGDIIESDLVAAAIDKYFHLSDDEKTIFQKMSETLTNTDNELKEIAKPFKTTLLSKYTSSDDGFKKRQAAITKNQSQKKSRFLQTRNKILKEGLSQKVLNDMEFIKLIPKTDQSHGNVNEIIRAALERTITFHNKTGVDRIVIPLGYLEGTIDFSQINTVVSNAFSGLSQHFEDYYKTANQERQNRIQDYQNQFIKMNENVQKTIDSTEIALKQIENIPDNIFIYHESVKLYATLEEVEEDGKRRTTGSFHGRNRNAMTVLNELYSIDNVGKLQLIDQELLYNIILNLVGDAGSDTAAVAGYSGTLRSPVERYLSIFAGLLMFDDIYNVAQEVQMGIDQISSNMIKQIHLYSINDQFIPSSLLLSNIAYNLEKATNAITANKAAKVTVENKGESVIAEYLQNRDIEISKGNRYYNLNQWGEVADEIAGKTTIDITFFASFLQFLTDLSKL